MTHASQCDVQHTQANRVVSKRSISMNRTVRCGTAWHRSVGQSDISRTSVEHQSNISRTSVEHQSDISRTSVGHQSNISRTSVEHQSDISRTSVEHQSDISRTSVGHQSGIEYVPAASRNLLTSMIPSPPLNSLYTIFINKSREMDNQSEKSRLQAAKRC